MTTIIKSKYKASRRLNTAIWGNAKDALHRKNYRPGQHGATSTSKLSDYGLHLKAKQMIKAHYGRIGEKQLKNFFKIAVRMKGNTGENFLALLERRLDTIVYRLNFAPTIFAARQMVSHKHFKVNGRSVNIPSYRVKDGDFIELNLASRTLSIIVDALAKQERKIPDYLALEQENFKGVFLRSPQITDVPLPFIPEVNLVVEFYSR